ncbi:hypothetical protein [Burkholderia cepacia]|uniref:hypothetical protein n=1 Tax=Burkholderia cepacia TaxID=292 RepID=UPI001F240400|nr:hypothetical protein [Burkholderia cepacia]UIY58164.1 hypothetical protein LZ568_08095 [Burkholderia cepacia]
MSDLMLLGILRMPENLIEGSALSLMQFIQAARGAADRIEFDAQLIDKLRAELEAAAADKRDAERYRYLRNRMRFTDQLPVATMMLSAPLLAPLHNFHTDWVGDRFDSSVDKTVDAARTGEHRD